MDIETTRGTWMNAKTITYTNAFYNRDVITITDIIDEKVEPKYDIILLYLKNNYMTAVISWSCQVTDCDTLLLIGDGILLLVQKWMIACNYSMTMLQLHSKEWWISLYWTVKLGKEYRKINIMFQLYCIHSNSLEVSNRHTDNIITTKRRNPPRIVTR